MADEMEEIEVVLVVLRVDLEEKKRRGVGRVEEAWAWLWVGGKEDIVGLVRIGFGVEL